MLLLIRTTICNSVQVYTHGEDERLGTAVLSIISRAMLSVQQVRECIASFAEPVLEIK